MPQQYTSTTVSRPARTRRARVLHAGVVAATAVAFTATSTVPATFASAAPLDVRPVGVTVAPTATDTTAHAPVRVDRQAASSVVTQASTTLAKAEHLTTEGTSAPAEALAEIAQTTSVVRELVRRVSTGASDPTTTPTAPVTPASPSDDAVVEPSGDRDVDSPTPEVMAPTVDATADARTTAAADAAVTAVVGEETPTHEATPDVVTAALEQQTAVLTELIAANPATALTATPAPPTPEEIAAQKAAEAAADAARLAALAQEATQYGNGQIPQHLLAELAWAPGEVLRADAAAQLTRLNEAFAAHFGRNLSITDTYRSFADQVAVKRSRGKWAATPGYSNHGYGVAVDLGGGVESFGTAEYQWMRAHAGDFGWENPEWAQAGGRKPEAWHWEFVG